MFATLATLCIVGAMTGCAAGARTAAPSPDGPRPAGGGGAEAALKLESFGSGFDHPVFVTNAADGSGRLFVVEQVGRVVEVSGDGSRRTFLDITDRVAFGGERGLLGLAFSPTFRSDGRLFVDYTDVHGDIVVAVFRAAGGMKADTSHEEAVLRIEHPAPNHNGGWIGFGPDHMLYITVGDGASPENAQRLDSLLGKVVRIDVLHELPYTVPPDNPVLGQHTRREIWAYGLRNPWRASFDRLTGDMYIGDVGASSEEEIDLIPAGQGGLNFGWPRAEGLECHDEPCSSDLKVPAYAYGRDVGSVVTGGYIYRGHAQQELQGTYIFGDFGASTISLSERSADGRLARVRTEQAGVAISSFGEDELGELYACDLVGGRIFRVVS
jgi:glucose/arabinose dehydrogenase